MYVDSKTESSASKKSLSSIQQSNKIIDQINSMWDDEEEKDERTEYRRKSKINAKYRS